MATVDRSVAQAVIVALGIAAGGALAGNGIVRARLVDRTVSVKGVSERPAKADLAIWPLRVVASDNDLTQANAKLEASVRTVRQFLARHQLDTTGMSVQDFSVTDAYLTATERESTRSARYIIREALVVRSTKPDLVLAASQRVAELVSAGVVLSSGDESGGGGPTFVFTGLNSLKPAMIAEATAQAREAAEQFARDSHSEVGGIRQASQGIFEILPRDQAPGISEESQVDKTVRVVSTIDYLLKN
jgi:uncharacterized protein